jgi:hypothetical protein
MEREKEAEREASAREGEWRGGGEGRPKKQERKGVGRASRVLPGERSRVGTEVGDSSEWSWRERRSSRLDRSPERKAGRERREWQRRREMRGVHELEGDEPVCTVEAEWLEREGQEEAQQERGRVPVSGSLAFFSPLSRRKSERLLGLVATTTDSLEVVEQTLVRAVGSQSR